MRTQPHNINEIFEELKRKRNIKKLDALLNDFPELLHTYDAKTRENILHEFTSDLIHPYIQWALDKGLGVNSQDGNGCTPLHIAADMDDGNTVDFLISKGADIEAVNKNGETPVLTAFACGSEMSAEYLIKQGAQYKKFDAQGDYAPLLFLETQFYREWDQAVATAELLIELMRRDIEWGDLCTANMQTRPDLIEKAHTQFPKLAAEFEAAWLRNKQPDVIVQHPQSRPRL